MAQNYTDSNRGVVRSVGGQDYAFVPTYLRPRNPISPVNASPDIKPKEQQGHYPVSSLWTNTVNQNVYVLAGIVNNLGNWVLITNGGSGPLLMLTGDDGVAVAPTAGGVINLHGLVVANATHAKAVFTESPSANTENIDIQVSAAIAATDITKVGLAAFNNTEFAVDSNGFVTLVGGGASIQKIAVDANTPPGTNPVVPVAGQITVTGGQVAAGVVGTNVIRTDSLAANIYTIEIQRSQAVATSTVADNGVSHFNSAQFTVDTNAFVSTKGNTVSWVQISASQTLVKNTGYFCISPGGALSLTLPSTASSTIGDLLEVTLDGATSWSIAQSAGQQIQYNNLATTVGVGGSLASTDQGNTIKMVYQATGKWNVISALGTLVVT